MPHINIAVQSHFHWILIAKRALRVSRAVEVLVGLGTAATVGTFFYALLYASSAVKMMQDLVWYRAAFEEEQLNQSDQVIPLQKGKG